MKSYHDQLGILYQEIEVLQKKAALLIKERQHALETITEFTNQHNLLGKNKINVTFITGLFLYAKEAINTQPHRAKEWQTLGEQASKSKSKPSRSMAKPKAQTDTIAA